MGESVILWIQQFSCDVLDLFFKTITQLGSEFFYLICVPIVFWCISKASGFRLAMIVSVSGFANTALKETFTIPRPDALRVRVLTPEDGFSFPSGHAQVTTTFWFTVAQEFARKWLWVLGCVIVFFVAISRMYLGVHYPTDLLGGFGVGLICAFGGVALCKRLEKPFRNLALPLQFIIAFFLPLVLLLFNRHEDAISMVGNICGFSVGAIIEREWIRFSEREALWKQIFKILLGLAFVFGIRVGLKSIFPEGDVFQFLRYAILGFSLAAIVPFLFTRISLAERQDSGIPM